jgi:hypothetical protein
MTHTSKMSSASFAERHPVLGVFLTISAVLVCFGLVGSALIMVSVLNFIGVHGGGPYSDDLSIALLLSISGLVALASSIWMGRLVWRRIWC